MAIGGCIACHTRYGEFRFAFRYCSRGRYRGGRDETQGIACIARRIETYRATGTKSVRAVKTCTVAAFTHCFHFPAVGKIRMCATMQRKYGSLLCVGRHCHIVGSDSYITVAAYNGECVGRTDKFPLLRRAGGIRQTRRAVLTVAGVLNNSISEAHRDIIPVLITAVAELRCRPFGCCSYRRVYEAAFF